MLPKWHKIASVTLYNDSKGLQKTKNNEENGNGMVLRILDNMISTGVWADDWRAEQ